MNAHMRVLKAVEIVFAVAGHGQMEWQGRWLISGNRPLGFSGNLAHRKAARTVADSGSLDLEDSTREMVMELRTCIEGWF